MKELIILYICDLIIGDPRWLPHPIRCIGRFITAIESLVRRFTNSPFSERVGGGGVVFTVVISTFILSSLFVTALNPLKDILLLNQLNLYHLLIGIAGSFTIALRSLIVDTMGVLRAVGRGEIELARKRLSYLVGRDTERLDENGIIRATVETIAENASDGVVAPLFYFALGGFPLAMAYKAVNTLDSMLGYKNERYRYFGFIAAKVDDIANYLPARITAALILAAAMLLRIFFRGVRIKKAVRILLRDGRKHPSPNAGIPEAAMAGVLGVVLGGPSYYGGQLHEKPYIGSGREELRPRDGFLAEGILFLSGSMAVVLFVVLTLLINSL